MSSRTFTVRCTCGNVFHSDEAHLGRQIRCRCGRLVAIEANEEERSAKKKAPTSARKRFVRRPRWLVVAVSVLCWSWLIASFLAWISIRWFAESWLPATALLYGPRHLLLYPALVLLPLALFVRWRLVGPVLLGAAIFAVPVAGWNVPLGALLAPAATSVPRSQTIRVVTYNVSGGVRVAPRVSDLMRELAPDIFVAQECSETVLEALRVQPGRFAGSDRSLCISSRWPISNMESMPNQELRDARVGGYGGTGFVVRAELTTPRGLVSLVVLHLETARKGLEGILGGDRSGASVQAAGNSLIRELESRRARAFAEASPVRPLIVAGDFNLPDQSPMYRRHWAGLRNAFKDVGWGFGWTKQEGSWIRIRIDHVLSDESLQPIQAFVGPDYGSDHRPLIADFHWPETTERGR